MKWTHAPAPLAIAAVITAGVLAASCGSGGQGGTTSGTTTTAGAGGSGGAGGSVGLTGGGGQGASSVTPSTLCGPNVEGCLQDNQGPTSTPPSKFPLPTDNPPPDNVDASNVSRDANGYLELDIHKVQSDYLWVANDMNYGVGFVSKVGTKPNASAPIYREVARYVTFTCQSDPVNGSKDGLVLGAPPPGGMCADGVHGCCARAETVAGPNGGHQPINAASNRPSRTAVDFNGDMWVANRAFGLQQSVTKIAGDPKRCIDRNKNGMIDTSSDVNSDGIINTDCNDDNLPDDGATVCTGGKTHEFYGLDDECVLFTVNIGQNNTYARALALAPADEQGGEFGGSGASVAWVGTWQDGMFYKVDGDNGTILESVHLGPIDGIASNPYGAAIDQYGILWAPNEGTTQLFYFDTKNTANQGRVAADSVGGSGFYGIAVDGYIVPGESDARQQVWLGEVGGAGAYRYRPVRTNGFDGLKQGTWALASFDAGPSQGRGIGVDNRKPTSFAWVALDGYPSGTPGAVGRIPTDIPDLATSLMSASSVFTTGQTGTLGAGVASNLDVWAVNQGSSSVVHFPVDPSGNVMGAPDLVPLDDKAAFPDSYCPTPNGSNCRPNPYTYSDFTGFGLVNFTSPKGYYSWIEQGCGDGLLTHWYAVQWDSDVPPGTSVSVGVRTAGSVADLKSASFTGPWLTSPASLDMPPGPVKPNPADYIEVRFVLSTTGVVSPKLKGFQIAFACETKVQ
ncbi:MAG: hypothetical protein U0359_32705 [Byssovorax sp.]